MGRPLRDSKKLEQDINKWINNQESNMRVCFSVGTDENEILNDDVQLKNRAKATSMSVDEIHALIDKAYSMKGESKFEEAFEVLEPLSRISPRNVKIHYHLGWIYLHRFMINEDGHPEVLAIKHFERACKGKMLNTFFRFQALVSLSIIFTKIKNKERANYYLGLAQTYYDEVDVKANGALQSAYNMATWMYDMLSETEEHLRTTEKQLKKADSELTEIQKKHFETEARLKRTLEDSHLIGIDSFGEYNLTLQEASIWLNSNEDNYIILDQTKEKHELKGSDNIQPIDLRDSLIIEKLMVEKRPLTSKELENYLSYLTNIGRITKAGRIKEEGKYTFFVKMIMNRLREKLQRNGTKGVLDDSYAVIPLVKGKVTGYTWNSFQPWRIVKHKPIDNS
ncbi:MAG: hypothetical protein OWR52_14310 [Acidibacillus sp.]|nr:hypothetical protein [Acidibacillus sp.]